MSSRYDFVTIGGITEDISLFTKEGKVIDNKKDLLCQKLLAFEYGAKIKIDHFYYSWGGGAANAAVGFAGFGFKTACIVNVGNDERGKKMIENLRERGVDTSLVMKDKKAESSFSFILIQNKERLIFMNRLANEDLVIGKKELTALKKTKYIYITALSGKYWLGNLRRIFSLPKAQIIWNPGHAQLTAGIEVLKPFLKKTAVFGVNKDEALELVMGLDDYRHKGNEFLNKRNNLLKIIKSLGPRLVVITDGKKGASIYDGERFYHGAIVSERKVADMTGVGDAFQSALSVGLERFKGDIKKSLYLAMKNAASVIEKQGAQNGLLTKKDLAKIKFKR
jgi:sugar/nucleoside kinase (ribokinase family)